jgi:hypothetical protein
VIDLYKKTGSTEQALKIVPHQVSVYKNGQHKQVALTAPQRIKYQKYLGGWGKDVLSAATEAPEFQKLRPDQQTNVMAAVLGEINESAKREILGNQSPDPTHIPSDLQLALFKGNLQAAIGLARMKAADALMKPYLQPVEYDDDLNNNQ